MRFAAVVGLLLVGRGGSREAAPPTDAFAYRACSSPMQAYAAAWFARVDAFLTTSFLNSPRMEAHDTAMFTADSGRGGAPRVALKPDRLHDFYVDHLSGREHELARRAKAGHLEDGAPASRARSDALALADGACARPCAARAAEPSARRDVLVLLPFWGGAPEAQFGNAHSAAPRETKGAWLRGALCAACLLYTSPSPRDS